MLPHGDARLGLLDQCGACSERIASMCGTHSSRECAVAYLEWARAMGDSDGDHVEALGNLGRDVGEDAARGRMGLVVQPGDGAPVVVVPHIS